MSAPLRLRMSVPEPSMLSRNLRDARDTPREDRERREWRHVRDARDLRPAPDLDETLPLGMMRRRPADEVLPMRCLSCQGRVERSSAPVQLVHDGCQVSWDAIPAWVCTQCRRAYFEPNEVELVRRSLRAIRTLPKPV